MKQFIVAISALIFLLMLAVTPIEATSTYMTTREDITVSAITVDIANWSNLTMSTTNTSLNLTLPCLVSNLTGADSYVLIGIGLSENISYNLTINGNAFNTTSQLDTDNEYSNRSLTNITTKYSAIASQTYLNIEYQSNITGNITVYIVAANAYCTATFVTSAQTVQQKDVTTPEVGTARGTSYFTVNDSINITHTVGYNLYDVNISLVYPSHRITVPNSYLNLGSITNNSYSQNYVNYQKRGPYIKEVEDDSTGLAHTVDIYVDCEEVLAQTVIFEITLSDSVYEGYLDTVDYDSLIVEYNGADIDWTEGSIDMEDLTLKSGWTTNKFTLSWTAEAPVPAPVVEPWWEASFWGFQIWIWMVIIVIIIVIIIAILVSKD